MLRSTLKGSIDNKQPTLYCYTCLEPRARLFNSYHSKPVRIRALRHFLSLFFVLLATFSTFYSLSYAEEPAIIELQKSYAKIQEKFDKLDKNKIKIQDLDAIQIENASLQIKMDDCISSNTKKLESAQKNLKLLGEKQSSEEPEIRKKRRELDTQIESINKEVKRCTLSKIQLDQLSKETISKRQTLLKTQLLHKELSFPSAIKKLGTLNEDLFDTESEAILPLFKKISALLNWTLLLLAIAGIASGALWQRYGNTSPLNKAVFSSPTFIAAIEGIRRTSPAFLGVLLVWVYLKLQDDSPLILLQTLHFSLVLLFMFSVIRGVVYPNLPSTTQNKVSRNSILILSWVFIVFSIVTFSFNHETSGRFSNSSVLYFIWFISLTLAALNFIFVLWMMVHKVFSERSFSTIYLIPMGSMIVSIIAAAVGYRNFATLLFFGTLNSLVVLIVSFFLIRISTEFFDSLDEGKVSWQKNLRATMRIEKDSAFPGVLWLRILFFFVIIVISVSALMFIWGSSQQQISTLFMSLKNGFTVGTVNLDILNIFYAILILVVTLSVLPFIKNQLVSGWLKHSNLSRGVKEATQTLVGYGGVAIAILWALYVLGVNFKNLAIIAGALSVGIGFGLQNIVNNFLSGIILLFERPVRRGDWVVIGETEGYVKKISIRSTTIQTFERADVIVPNSELISNQVTNWVLSSSIGRLKVPVGVAYGSDVSHVMKILEEVANNHHAVIKNHPEYPVRVLFLQFGDNSLNFELRCFIRNVDNRLSTLSDINQAIDREFRKANIEIPFPQRVVHIKSQDHSE